MIPAKSPRAARAPARLLEVDPARGALSDRRVPDLLTILRRDDVLVVNDAATLPAALRGVTGDGRPVELRLAAFRGEAAFLGVLLAPGDPHQRTEELPPAPSVAAGDELRLGTGAPGAPSLTARIAWVDPKAPRLLAVTFRERGAAFYSALYRIGRPVQYAYVERPLALWDVQTPYASRPFAFEPPSAGLVLGWDLLLGLRRAGVLLTALTHAAGLSSTGSAELDLRLPLPERYEIPAATAEAVLRARAAGGRVVAVGTTVVRALEGAARDGGGRLVAGEGVTDLVLDGAHRPLVVDGLLTGVHERGTSHFRLLAAFAPAALLERALAWSDARGYLSHELGDAWLVLGGSARDRPPPGA